MRIPVLWPCLVLLLGFVSACGAKPPGTCAEQRVQGTGPEETTEVTIAAGLDDAYATPSESLPRNNEVLLGSENGGLSSAGLRFLHLPVPRCAAIRAAALAVTPASDYTAVIDVRIAAALGAAPANFDTRSALQVEGLTTTTAPWSITGPWTYDQRVTSSDVSGVLQELIDSTSWARDGHVLLRLDSVSVDPAGEHRRVFAWERDPTKAATLRVTFAPAK